MASASGFSRPAEREFWDPTPRRGGLGGSEHPFTSYFGVHQVPGFDPHPYDSMIFEYFRCVLGLNYLK